MKIVALGMWCLALVILGGFPVPQGVMLGLVTAWLLAALVTKDIRDLIRPLSQRSVSFLDSAMILVLKLGAVAFGCLALIFAGGFSLRQGILLGVILSWLLAAALERAVKPVWRFSPYHVRVQPNWYQLLSDFKLIGTPEEWWSVRESLAQVSPGEYRVLRDGISFTVVEQSKDLAHALIFANGGYRSRFEFEADMNPIQIEREDAFPHFSRSQRITLFMRSGFHPYSMAGYGLGMDVPAWWWEKVKGSCPAPLHESSDDLTGYVKLVLATISCREFELYWQPSEWSDEFFAKTAKEISDRRDEHRAQLRWTAEEFNPPPGFTVHFMSIQHKYFNLTHQSV